MRENTAGAVATGDYLFVPNVQAFRQKIARETGAPALLWRNIQTLPNAGNNSWYSPAFCYLATGDDQYAAQALTAIRGAMTRYLAGDLSLDVQFHTWCNSAPMARLATMLDWIADSPAVPAEDFSAIKEAMLDYTFKHPFNIAKSRMRSFDNQIASMSFCCALIGYLFGVKRGNDLRAQQLLSAGAMRFPDIFALSPHGGYSYEGSTYFCQIVAPVVSWYCALMEQITGEDVFSKRFPPTMTSPEDILRTYLKIIGPTGLMPPWDNYGWMRCCSLMGLAYLARKTGDVAPLQVIERLGLALEPMHIAWGSDDRLWTLIWWPDDLQIESTEGAFPSWAIDNVAGALVSEKKGWRLFQAWDECSPGTYCGRAQVNPNMLALDLWGSPIFTDGTPSHEQCTQFDYPIEVFERVLKPGELESIENYYKSFRDWEPKWWVKAFSYGLVGASNSIVVNGEGFYSPTESKEGKLVAFAALPNFKLLASDAAAFYQPDYPIESMVRTSALVRDDYFLVSDAIRTSGEGLRYDWQVFARGEVTTNGSIANIVTTEGVEVDIQPLDPGMKLTLTPVPGFPNSLEGSSTLIQYHAEGNDVTMPFLLVPHRRAQVVADLGEGWSSVGMDREAGIAQGLHHGVRGKSTVTATEVGLLPSPDGEDGWVWASRSFSIPAEARGKRIFIHIASRTSMLEIWVNGQTAILPGMPEKVKQAGDWLVPALVEITDLVKDGENTLVVSGVTTQGKLMNGAVELMVEVKKPALPEIAVLSKDHYAIAGAFGRDELILNPSGAAIVTATLQAQAQAMLLAADGSFAGLQATRINIGEVDYWSDRPLDVACAAGCVTLGDLSGPEDVELITPDFRLQIESRGVLGITLTGSVQPKIITSLDHQKPVFVNGVLTDIQRNPHNGRVEIDPGALPAVTPSDPAMPEYVKQIETLMRAASQADAPAVRQLIAALNDANWKVQQTAAELLGRIGAREAIEPLLALLARETTEVIYADDTIGWNEAGDKLKAEGEDRFRIGSNGRDMTERHRVKTVVIEALGRLRAREAVPALCRIIEDQREFYPVHSLACRALGQIGDPTALPTLQIAADYAEVNTKVRAKDAISRITEGKPQAPEYPDRSVS